MKLLLFTSTMPSNAREKILFAALQLFTARSYNAISILEIVEHAHVSKTTFYQYFSSKEELLTVLVEQLVDEILGEVHKAIEGERDFSYKGYAGIRRYIQLCTEQEAVAKFLLVSSVGVSTQVEEVRRQAHIHFSQMIFQTAQRGMPPTVSDASIQVVSRAMVGAVNEVVIQQISDGEEKVEIDELARLLNRIVVGSFTKLVLSQQDDG
ncbi:TetR/AcrR family transcriptional regulator [Marininema halotolerans]|uniref:DNA-binding transcriptional regulator, AcrR family n=1 Tax=Marininema halotolerans TaxID=1155944 RepID=A0A1I6RJL0_9BACL|nr:TetR/AcrR family transcriptional regulator [Marininema halotolerans]SFS64834.1 DNA-binding transcriptional regulator, AcrR family [Marininema halotolerans]